MTPEIRLANAVSEIEKEWDSLTDGRPFQSSNWYRFGEFVMAGRARPHYVLLSEAGRLIGGAAFWDVREEAMARGLVSALIRRWPLLVCESPLSYMSGLVVDSSMDGLAEIARVGRHLRHQEKCLLLFFDCLDGNTARAIPRSIPYSFNALGMVLNVQGHNFDEYLAGLPNKAARAVRHDLRKIEEEGIAITRHRMVDDLDSAESLFRALERRKGRERNPWVRAMLQNMEIVNGTWLAAHDAGGQLVGCVAAFEDNGAQLLTLMGLREGTRYAYFALLYEAIRLGLEHGLHSLYWGTGAYDVKKRLGFTPFENNVVAIAL